MLPYDLKKTGNSAELSLPYRQPATKLKEKTELSINSQKLYKYIEEELDDREREIICKRYEIRDGRGYACKAMTQREISKQLKISRSYISRIEKKALEKLRKRFEEG